MAKAKSPIVTRNVPEDPNAIFYYAPAGSFMGLSKIARFVHIDGVENMYEMFLELSTEESTGAYYCKLAYIADENTIFIWDVNGAYTNYMDTDYVFQGDLYADVEKHNMQNMVEMNCFGEFEEGIPEALLGVFGCSQGNTEIKYLNYEDINRLCAKYSSQNNISATLGLRGVLGTDLCRVVADMMLPEWLLRLTQEELDENSEVLFDYDAPKEFMRWFYDTGMRVPDAAYAC